MPNEITPGMVGYAHAMTDAADQQLTAKDAEAADAYAAAEADGWQNWDTEIAADDARHAADLALQDHQNAAYSEWLMANRPWDAAANEPRPDPDPEPASLDQDIYEPDSEPEPEAG